MSQPQPPQAAGPTCYRHPGRETWIRCQRCDRPICPDCMRDAAVGFQCPECVAAGAKQTRQDRTAFGGRRSGNPAATSIALIGVNVAVWVAVLATGGYQSRLLDLIMLRARGYCSIPQLTEAECARSQLGQWVPGVSDGAVWQLVTNAFAHEAVWHIGFNMLALWILGPQLEAALGRARFLALYLLSALSGSALVYWLAPDFQATLGASGAIFGLFGAIVVLSLRSRTQLQPVLVLIGINAVITFTVPGISWEGHVGGFLGGLVVTAALVLAPRQRRTAWQVAGLAAVALVLVVAFAARTLVLL